MPRRISLCKNCEFFEKHKKNDIYDIFSTHYGYCLCPKFCYDMSDEDDKDFSRLYYMDGEGWSASLEVGENFGCVHFLNKASDCNE